LNRTVEDLAKAIRNTPVTVDINSLCGFPTDLAVFRRGIKWYSRPRRTDIVKGQTHGIHLPVTLEDGTEELVPLDKIPQMHFGHLPHWD
jgi:hypothetical protein